MKEEAMNAVDLAEAVRGAEQGRSNGCGRSGRSGQRRQTKEEAMDAAVVTDAVEGVLRRQWRL